VVSSRKDLMLRLERHRPDNISYTVHFPSPGEHNVNDLHCLMGGGVLQRSFTTDDFIALKEKNLGPCVSRNSPAPRAISASVSIITIISFDAHVNCAQWRHLERDRIPSGPTTYRLQLVFHQMQLQIPHPPRAFRSRISTIPTTYPMHHPR
jgi:hypothetical protein